MMIKLEVKIKIMERESEPQHFALVSWNYTF